MKIVFDDERQRDQFVYMFAHYDRCPEYFGLQPKKECGAVGCRECWIHALEMEVKK